MSIKRRDLLRWSVGMANTGRFLTSRKSRGEESFDGRNNSQNASRVTVRTDSRPISALMTFALQAREPTGALRRHCGLLARPLNALRLPNGLDNSRPNTIKSYGLKSFAFICEIHSVNVRRAFY